TGIEARLPRAVRQELLLKQCGVQEPSSAVKPPYKAKPKGLSVRDMNTYQSLITSKVGKSLATDLRAAAYAEVSTKTFEGIEELFSDVVTAIVTTSQSKICLMRNHIGRPRPMDACTIM
ncbi:hypothetical protein AB6A40_011154, partial [Gnathostoma spinigerum]